MVARRCVAISVVRPRMSSLIVSMMAASVVGSNQQDTRLFKKGARNSDTLPLPYAQVSAAFTHRRVVAVGQFADEIVSLSAFSSIDNLLLGRVGTAIRNIFAHRCRE